MNKIKRVSGAFDYRALLFRNSPDRRGERHDERLEGLREGIEPQSVATK